MRDLGLMGENSFSSWCADAGLIPNGSKIDKTGWDFFVEFPLSSGTSSSDVHKSAFEFKIQVKATDKQERKLSIKLSNLRRLITSQMPAFFVFIEFDGKTDPQRAFLIHVNKTIISKVLKRLYEIEQSEKKNNFNKRTLTIHYDDSHSLENLTGNCLKTTLLSYMGEDMAEYIAEKKSFLETTGFEDGFGQMTFSMEDEGNVKTLIDVSLGIEKQVNISRIIGNYARFGIMNASPFAESESAKLEMPDLTPDQCIIRFKEGNLSGGLSFEAKFYTSPFNKFVPDKLIKIRIKGEFFNINLTPHTGVVEYSFSFGDEIRLEVRKFRDAIKLLSLLNSSRKYIFAELIFKGKPEFQFKIGCREQGFDFSKELKTLESAATLLSEFNMTEFVDISFNEVFQYETSINQIQLISSLSSNSFKVEFSVDDDSFDSSKDVACICIVATPIGCHIFGIILVLIGKVEKIKGSRYKLLAKEFIVERRIVSERNEIIQNEDLVILIEEIKNKYDNNYSVISMIDNTRRNKYNRLDTTD